MIEGGSYAKASEEDDTRHLAGLTEAMPGSRSPYQIFANALHFSISLP